MVLGVSEVMCVCTGALAELSTSLESQVGKYVEKLVPILLRELRCEDSGNRRNAAFCVGIFCQCAPQQMQSHVMQLLQVCHHTVKDLVELVYAQGVFCVCDIWQMQHQLCSSC